jgi:hypothetical protein
MSQPTCLLLKPQPSTADGIVKQQNDIRDIVEDAINGAGLRLLTPSGGQVVDNDIPPDLINQVYDADIIVIDLNCYEPEGYFKFSPFLYYLMGMRHARGNRTILVCADATKPHLPATLQMPHTLFYGSGVAAARQFARRFAERVQKMAAEGDLGEPGNPVQAYRQHKEQKELAAERDHLRTVEKVLQEEIKIWKERAESSQRPSTAPQRIQFRPLGQKE